MDSKYSTGWLCLISLIWLRKHETKSKFTTRQTAGRRTNRKGGLVTVGGEIQIGSWAQIQSGEWANPAFAAFNIADSPPAPVGSNLLARRSQTLCSLCAKMIMKKKMCGLKTQVHVDREIWAKKSEFAEGANPILGLNKSCASCHDHSALTITCLDQSLPNLDLFACHLCLPL